MAGPWFFAWTGGAPLPADNLDTTGDIWSGTFLTTSIVWGGQLRTTGEVLAGGRTLANLLSRTGLVSGGVYTIKGGGIPSIIGGYSADTTLTYDGAGGGTLAQACVPGAGISLTLTSAAGQTTVLLDKFGPLVNGATYDIAGSGIPSGTTFVFGGAAAVTLSTPATATGDVSVTITSLVGIAVIRNLASTTGLVSGLTHEVFGLGLPAGAQATYSGGGELALLVKPTKTGLTVPINISKGKTYPDGGAFNSSVHEVFDEDVFSVEITHTEGGFAALTLEVKNPRIGLLAAGRNLWCWLSWRNALGTVVPLFHGRLVGVPADLQNEIVKLLFVARPNDFVAQRVAAAAALRVLPYWDPVWLIDKIEDPDTVLETYTSLWHIDPTTLLVTTSDILQGEDGTIDVAESEHFYDAMTVSYGSAPLRQVNVTATVTWTQSGTGDVDLTTALVKKFQDAGSPYAWPKISSYTADGLLTAWPIPLVGLGGGWTIGDATIASLGALSKDLSVKYTDKTGTETYTLKGGTTALPNVIDNGLTLTADWKNFDVVFTLGSLNINLTVHYEASRKGSEIASFIVKAEVQSLLSDPLTSDEESISLSSAFVELGVDDDGEIPLGDLRSNSYFPTDRGQQSLQYVMLLAGAKLLARARAVDITFATTWDKLAGAITCRKNVTLHDARLPGGTATGKVKSYRLAAGDTAGSIIAEVTIGCTIGYGDTITPAAGVDSYADTYSTGYDEAIGSQVSVIAGKLVYQSLDGAYVIDDDGVDLFNMTADTIVTDILVVGGADDQEAAINDALKSSGNSAVEFGALYVGDVSRRRHGDGAITGITATAAAATGSYQVQIIAGSRFTVTSPAGLVIGRGTLGTAFKAGGLAFTLAQGVSVPFVVGDSISITVTKKAAGAIGLVPDPIGALSALPTQITLDLVPVTGGDFESDYTLKVLPLTIPKTIDLEHV